MTNATGDQPHYSMVIEWDSREGGYYVVSLPEWEAAGDIAHEFGTTYEEAAAKGRDLLEFLIQSTREEGLSLPAPRMFAEASTLAST